MEGRPVTTPGELRELIEALRTAFTANVFGLAAGATSLEARLALIEDRHR